MRRTLFALVAFACARPAPAPPPAPIAPAARVVSAAPVASEDELVIPFYEGVRAPAGEIPWLEIPYPGVLSVPMIAFGSGADWNAIFAPLDALGTVLRIRGRDVELRCASACSFRTAHGASWEELARAVARAYDVHAESPPLASRYVAAHFYVRDWISQQGEPRRTAWTKDALRARLDREEPNVLEHVYGIDPGGIDLGGEYLREPSARAEAAAMIREHPRLAFFSWLNLRTYKFEIPATHAKLPMTPAVKAMARLGPGGVRTSEQWGFRAWEMCLGSREWQASRMRELEKLVALGYRVIALDEFPIPIGWEATGCTATNHLHRPGDFADEARVAREFVARIAAYARAHGVLLGAEEPSAALLPMISGYVDRLANPPAMYEIWQKVKGATPVPLFSTMFGDLATPYTDPSPSAPVPRGWITTTKIESP